MTPPSLLCRRLTPAAAAVAASLALAACGSSASSSSATTTRATTTATGAHAAVSRSAFVTCLKQHGVTLPARRPGGSPPAGGGFFFGGAPGGGAGRLRNNPKLRAAFRACGGGLRFRGAGRLRISHARIQQYVSCVRRHGYPQMPNPNFSGHGAVFPASIRTNPKFQAASRACQSVLLAPRPTGGASGSSA